MVTIYTLGDLELFRMALQAVAMLFSPAEVIWTSPSLTGLGAVAGLGLLVSLGVIAISGIMRQEVRLDILLVLMILYAVAFVP
ncbi:MAG: hypothetical protein D6819_10010, partial [Gammaproteobacteria bacterium]